MDDKKQLIDSTYDIDRLQPLPSDINRKNAVAEGCIEDHQLAPRRSWGWCSMILLLTGILAASAVFIVSFTSRRLDSDYVKFRTSFKGGSGHLVDQEVVSSGINNIVEYYVTVSEIEQVTIVDDFNLNIQIMKISNPDDEICYVSELKQTAYVRPEDVLFGSKAEKGYVSQVFESSGDPIDGQTVLGIRGGELCRDIPTYWIHPVTETPTTISADNFTLPDSSSGASNVRSRSKRNIKACHSSCCWQVCCCDVKHFNWESVEHFTCRHVCTRCTKQYHSVVRRLCP